jgi:hypothetical protein
MHFPPNVVAIFIGNLPKAPVGVSFLATGVAVLSGALILRCFMAAFRAFQRAQDLQDRIARLLLYREGLPPRAMQIIEDGPQEVEGSIGEDSILEDLPVRLSIAWPVIPELEKYTESEKEKLSTKL